MRGTLQQPTHASLKQPSRMVWVDGYSSQRRAPKLMRTLCSFARKGGSEGRGQGRVRDDLLVVAPAHADDAEAHVAAQVVGGVDANGKNRYRYSGEALVS